MPSNDSFQPLLKIHKRSPQELTAHAKIFTWLAHPQLRIVSLAAHKNSFLLLTAQGMLVYLHTDLFFLNENKYWRYLDLLQS